MVSCIAAGNAAPTPDAVSTGAPPIETNANTAPEQHTVKHLFIGRLPSRASPALKITACDAGSAQAISPPSAPCRGAGSRSEHDILAFRIRPINPRRSWRNPGVAPRPARRLRDKA